MTVTDKPKNNHLERMENDILKLEEINKKLQNYLLKYLNIELPLFKDYKFGRVKTIDLLTQSLSRVSEILFKYRKELVSLENSGEEEKDLFLKLLQAKNDEDDDYNTKYDDIAKTL